MKKFFALFLVVVLSAVCSLNVNALDCFALSAIVINCDTGSVLYSKNSDVKLPMASTTKIMTAVLLIEQNTPEREVTVTREMVTVEGSSMGLAVGDIVTYNDLLYGLMLPSGNDAANTIAIAVAGSTEKFAELMNKKADELGLKNTHFVTPSGLDGNGHGTTAFELATIAKYAMQYDSFKKAVKTKSICLQLKNGRKITLSNHNKLLNLYNGAIGIKTGYTSSAGRCLVSAATRDGTTLICVTLNDKNDWKDHINMLDYGFSLCKTQPLVTEIPNRLFSADGKQNTELELGKETLSVCENDKISYEIFLPRFLFSDINKGEKIGFVKVYCNNSYVKSIPIFAKNSLHLQNKDDFFDIIIKNFLMMFRSI